MLDRQAVNAVDSTGQLDVALALGDQLRDALARTESAGLPRLNAPGGLVVAGMGGSAVGARLALGLLADRARRPVMVADGYSLPRWAGGDVVVLCSSYSGNTEETLACYEQARTRGATVVAATTGGELADRARRDGAPIIRLPAGLQPRAAVGYALVAALEAAVVAGAAPCMRGQVHRAASLADELAAEWAPDGDRESQAQRIARRLEGTVPVIIGAGLTAPAAYRWKCQLNENAKVPAFASILPEADHNEVCGWATAAALGPFSVILLEHAGGHPRLERRGELTAGLAAAGARAVVRVTARGDERLAQLISLVLLGDVVSLYLAVLRGVDPVEIEAIAQLKAALAA